MRSFERINQNSAEIVFPQDFHTRKLGKISVFYAVTEANGYDFSKLKNMWQLKSISKAKILQYPQKM